MSPPLNTLVTPVIEITHVRGRIPLVVMAPSDRVELLKAYQEPQLQNHGSEKFFLCTHKEVLPMYSSSRNYTLLNVTGDPIENICLSDQVALRYQLNPHHSHSLQPRRNGDVTVYESFHLREIFIETVPLHGALTKNEILATDALYGMCGVNVYAHAEGVFSPPGVNIPVGQWKDSGVDGHLVLIYSTIPSVRGKLQRAFDATANSPSLIVDDVFIGWDSLGWLSLNELHDMGALHIESVFDDVFDLELA